MKHFLLVTLLFSVFLVACAPQPTDFPKATPPPVTPYDAVAEESQVRLLVGTFGKRLQSVALLAPDAIRELQAQYAEFVTPTLLQAWMADPSKAPGRVTSSPWPDRIEITNLAWDGNARVVVTGFVIEVTSVEAVSGGAAVRIPVRIVVEKIQGRWLITEYTQQ